MASIAQRSDRSGSDIDAFAQIYNEHAATIFGLARRVVQDRHAAEEIVQDTFLALWEHPARFDPQRGSLRSYLCTIAHRRCVDLVRSQTSRRRRELATQTRDHWEGVEDDACRSDEGRRVRAALAELAAELHTPIELAYFGALTYRQVADVLGLPEGTVKTRIRTALGLLATQLQPHGTGQRASSPAILPDAERTNRAHTRRRGGALRLGGT